MNFGPYSRWVRLFAAFFSRGVPPPMFLVFMISITLLFLVTTFWCLSENPFSPDRSLTPVRAEHALFLLPVGPGPFTVFHEKEV